MANFLGGTPTWMSAEYLENVFRGALKDPELKLTKYLVTPGSVLGDNSLGQIFRIKATINALKEVSIIGKLLKSTPIVDSIATTFDMFEVETRMLGDMLPLLNDKFDMPRFYPSLLHVDREHKIMYVEDLCELGFRLADRSRGLDLKHSLLVMKTLGKLHGSGLRLLKENPTLKTQFPYYNFNGDNQLITTLIMSGYEALVAALPSWPISEESKQKIRNVKDVVIARTYEASAVKEDHLNTLLHADCWINNMMFRYDEEGQVQEVKLIDYQVSNYNGVSFELVYFIFSSTNSEVCTKYLDHLLATYYETLLSSGADIPEFSLSKLKKEILERLFFALCSLFCFVPIVFTPKTEAVDLNMVAKDGDYTKLSSGYNNSVYIEHFTKLLPLFETHNVL